MHFILEYPLALLLLPLALCFIYCKKQNQPFYIPKLEWIKSRSKWSSNTSLLKILTFLLLIFALASPIVYSSIIPNSRSGRAIVLALDTSGSMRESGIDKSGKSKFEIVLDLVSDFIDKRESDNIGVVAFGTFAFTASPITYDHAALKEILRFLEVEIAGKNTAIADALDQSLKTLSFSKAKQKIIILLTDGMNNAGSISINQAIDEAKSKGVKVYTIGLGKKGDFDEELLRHISQSTNAKTFKAKDKKELEDVYEELNRLIPSSIRSQNFLDKKELFIYPLLLATLLALFLYAKEEAIV